MQRIRRLTLLANSVHTYNLCHHTPHTDTLPGNTLAQTQPHVTEEGTNPLSRVIPAK
jgi:hypothetical protein